MFFLIYRFVFSVFLSIVCYLNKPAIIILFYLNSIFPYLSEYLRCVLDVSDVGGQAVVVVVLAALTVDDQARQEGGHQMAELKSLKESIILLCSILCKESLKL